MKNKQIHQQDIRNRILIKVDKRGRIILPAEIIKRAEGEFIITCYQDTPRMLFLCPRKQWDVIEKRIIEYPAKNEAEIQYKRYLIGMAYELFTEGNRILIPKELRDWSGVNKRLELSTHPIEDSNAVLLTIV